MLKPTKIVHRYIAVTEQSMNSEELKMDYKTLCCFGLCFVWRGKKSYLIQAHTLKVLIDYHHL